MSNGLIKNKRSVMAVSGLMVLLFHFWATVFLGNKVEMFIKSTAYIGVDMFFFLSAYSIGSRRIDKIGSYYKSRFFSVYLKFILFTIAAWLILQTKWDILRVLKVIVGVELFEKGGGAFLWFLPAILILYIIMPFYQKAYEKAPKLTAILTCAVWLLVGILVTYLTSYKKIFIFWNRLPIFFLGFFAAKIPEKAAKKIRNPFIGLGLLVLGSVLLYFTGFTKKLGVPMVDFFYVCAIPATLGFVILTDFIPENPVTNLLGSATLELYGVQMIMMTGFKIMKWVASWAKTPILSNLVNIAIAIAIALVLSLVYNLIYKNIKKLIRNKKAQN